MKYIRNSGRKKSKPEKPKKQKTGKRGKGLTKQEQNTVANQIVKDAEWFEMLSESTTFSKDWIQKVLLELLMQCMGKKDILTTNMFGQQIVARMFKEKGAIKVAEIFAKMEGHLFDTVKGSIGGKIEHDHKHTVEMLPDRDRTGSVLGILDQIGYFNPQTKRLTKDDVEIISA